MLRTSGALASREPVLASFPVPCSKKTPYPPRIEVLPSPHGSQAKPTRGAGLNKCPFMQLAGVPLTPHLTRPRLLITAGSNCNVVGLNCTEFPWHGAIDEYRSTPEHGSTANCSRLNFPG